MNRKTILFLLIFTSLLFSQEFVNIITVDGVINPVATEYIRRSIEKSEQEGAECLIILLDTPGGLMASMREITQFILTAEIPVVVYVYPPGAHAGSAGVFITLSAHIAAMAPGTNIGAASVVSMGMGQADSANTTMMRKATNDAVAFIKSIAEQRGRNVDWAEKAVTEAAAISATEALKLNVIDLIATDLDTLLIMIDGKEVETTGGKKVLHTRQTERRYLEMSFQDKVLNVISDPTIAYILFIIGLYGLFFELYIPGAIFPGVIGAICLILAFYALHTLPVNYAGILLILLAIILFLLEIKITSYGILTIGGVISFVLGSIMLYNSDAPFLKVSWEVILAVTICTALFFVVALGLGIKAQSRKPTIGREYMIDAEVTALEDFMDGQGQVMHEGEIWKAVSEDAVKKGDRLKVVAMKGLTLKVVKISDGA
ncbi:MAG: nodulation protein NfeD [Calditrichaeota bacterium]|nr:MAG: nodulation protein NfeD [Calditrichota bacterium]